MGLKIFLKTAECYKWIMHVTMHTHSCSHYYWPLLPH